ncbi:MAG: 4Fe-4S dicluster domain-containing protein [Planctomycetes bacterium]|nr:4Fe-4S dicluster domain-containing protein [Planctomycetota bacterium]
MKANRDGNIGLLFDATRCIGCLECVKACKADHGLDPEIGSDLDASTYTVVEKRSGQHMRRMCMHCLNPTCASVCPVAALRRGDGGQVTYDADACMGCRYCLFACPFNVPRYEWHKRFPSVSKCDFCVHRTSKGGETACSWVCPTHATVSGKRKDLLTAARDRISRTPGRYVDHIYGENEVGGTSVLILSGIPFSLTGYKTDIYTQPLPELTWRVLEKLPYVCANGAIILGGLTWIIRRRIHLAEHPELAHGPKNPGKAE